MNKEKAELKEQAEKLKCCENCLYNGECDLGGYEECKNFDKWELNMIEFNTNIDFSDCKNEQQFKMKYIKNILRPQFEKVFCIETEETVKGFPDVMCLVGKEGRIPHVFFYEFKYSNAQGKIKFQPTQPAFYKTNNAIMNIWIVAYNKKKNSVVEFPVWDMSSVKGERKYYMNEKAEVQL